MGRMGGAELLILAVIGLILYLIPTVIAISRNHPSKSAIILLNLLLGWTFLGWVAALIWSFTATTIKVKYNPASANQSQSVVVNNTYSEVDNREARIKSESTTTHTENPKEYSDKYERLQKLKQLLDDGILTEEEFSKEKGRILQ